MLLNDDVSTQEVTENKSAAAVVLTACLLLYQLTLPYQFQRFNDAKWKMTMSGNNDLEGGREKC